MENNFGYFDRPNDVRIRFGKWRSNREELKGTVVFLNGRTEFMEKYSEAFEKLNDLGLDVFSFDWRGQGLSSRMLDNRRKGYVGNYDDYIGDMEALTEKIFASATRGPRILAAHSMGGHIGLRYLKEHAGFFDKAVLLSPMVDINTFPFPKNLLVFFTRAAVSAGFEKAYATGGDSLVEDRFEGNSLTSDRERFERAIKQVEKNPKLAIGGVTFGWLKASFDSVDVLHPHGYPESIETPTAIFSASEDRVVSNAAQRRICRRLPHCRLVEVPGARHEILQEKDELQKLFWDDFKEFIGSNGADSI